MLNNTKICSIIDKGIRQWKMVCNPTREEGSPTPNGNHIYMQVGCRCDRLLLRPFPHLSLVVEEPNAWKSVTDKTHSYHTGKEELMDQTPQVHRSTQRICNYLAFLREEPCMCQIKQHSYMWNITHTLVRATVVSTSGRAWMYWLFDVSLFMVVTFRNGKMRRNRSIGTTSVRVFFPLPSHIKVFHM
jgi:hypothetical protein